MEDDKIDIGEAGHRAELVCQEDIAKVAKLTKNELQEYTHSRLGKKLDLSRRISLLRIDVIGLIKNKLKLPTTEVEAEKTGKKSKAREVEFIFEPKRRRVFEATEALKKRTDLIHCWLVDKDGNSL